ncbi:MAG: sodium:solute symporter family transporter [Bacteriovoracaceae bacterium]
MHLSALDFAVVVGYIILVFGIAINANIDMRRHFALYKNYGLRPIENHYLAGGSITFWEAVMSIIATEFSAIAFLTIPTYAYFDNFNYIRFVIGACISRALISRYFLDSIYGKGLTIFEILARGIHSYKRLTPEGIRGKRTFAFFYLITKTVGVSIKLLGGAMLIAEFFDIPLFSSIVMISLITYLYIMIGGLKAVVRTDMIQAAIFIFGGVMAHYVVSKVSPLSWGELFSLGLSNGKFSFFSEGGGAAFVYGIIAGIAYDAATHGVDQDLVQKLIGSKDIQTAKKALAWSAMGSIIVNTIFLSLGVILWSYYHNLGQSIPSATKLFSSLIEEHFPSPVKGLMVASILAACMSTLDSSINALSACFWNDFMGSTKSKLFSIYISMDNFIITISIIIVSFTFSALPGFVKYGTYFAYLSMSPLLSFFISRLLLSRFIKIDFSPSLIVLSICTSFLGMGLNHFRFGFNPQLTILWGIVTAIIFMWMYSLVNNLFKTSKEK